MTKINIKVVANEGAKLPLYKTSGAAGADICALLKEPLVIESGKSAMVPTGLFFEIPQGYEVQIRPRSGLAAKKWSYSFEYSRHYRQRLPRRNQRNFN
ncbi:hypothetical protein MSI_10900 [Treponema sp. JC4]|nr:hypothetical protein MSI_10900 [Treponema sp. JC4]